MLGLAIRACFTRSGGFWGGFACLIVCLTPGFVPVGRWGNHYTFLILGMALIFWSSFRAIQNSKGWLWAGVWN